jgi:hypothetical protein
MIEQFGAADLLGPNHGREFSRWRKCDVGHGVSSVVAASYRVTVVLSG